MCLRSAPPSDCSAGGGIIASVGWREGLLIGAGVGLATLILMFVLFPTPPSSSGEVLQGEHLGPESLRRVFGNSTLWIMGFALLGGYGSYFSAAQLLPHQAQSTLDIDAGTVEAISVILLGRVDIQRRAIAAPARWIMAPKLTSVLS